MPILDNYTISPIWGAGAQLFDNNGNILAGGKIYTYYAGSTTPLVTYTNPLGTNANTNPIIANAAGRLTNEIWFPVSGSYKFILKDANDGLIATYDNIPTTPQPPIVNDASSISYEQGYEVNAGNFTIGATYLITSVGTTDFVAIGASANQAGVLFTATGVGSGTGKAQFSRTVEQKFQEVVSVKDFGAVGDGVTDDTISIQAAIAKGQSVYFPSGTYKVTSTLSVTTQGQYIYGDGYQSFLSCASGTLFDVSASNVTITDLRLWGGYVADNIGITCSGAQCKFLNLDVRLFDVGFEWTGGFHCYIQNWHTRNFRTYGIALKDGVGAFISNVTYDTDGSWYGGSYVMPTAFLLVNNEGNVVSDCDFIHPGVGVLIEPDGRNIEWCMFNNCFIADSGFVTSTPPAGILIRQSSNTYYIRGLFFDQVWSATNNRGLVIDGTGSASVGGLVFTDCMLHNNAYEGVRITCPTALNITFNSCQIASNNSGNHGANQFYVDNANIVNLTNCALNDNFNWSSTVYSQLFVDTNADNVTVTNCDFGTNVSNAILNIYNGTETQISYPRWYQINSQNISASTSGVIISGDWLSAFDEVLIVCDNIAHTDTGDLNIKLSPDGGSNWSNFSYQSLQNTTGIEEYEQNINGNRLIPTGSNIQATLQFTNNRVGYKQFTYQSSLNAASGQNLMSIGTVNNLNPINTIFFGWSIGNLTGGTIRVFVK